MKNKPNRGLLVVSMVFLLLIILACTCGPLSGVTDAAATVQSAQGTLGAFATEASTAIAEMSQQAPSLNATLTAVFGEVTPSADTEGDTGGSGAAECTSSTAGTPEGYLGPVYDGGDGLTTTFIDTLAIGETKTACIASLLEAHNWLFEGTAGQTITIRVIATTEADPRLYIIDPDGNVLEKVDDTEGYNPIVAITLPAAGAYTFRVDTLIGNGEYSITVE